MLCQHVIILIGQVQIKVVLN
jgi:hypothetical protein